MAIRVIVQGALGRMGRETVRALCQDADITVVGATELAPASDRLGLPDGGSVPLSGDLAALLDAAPADVLVDFSLAAAVMPAARVAAARGVNLVIGTTGLSPEDLDEIGRLAEANGIGAVVAPNFTIGAVLMMHLASIAAAYMDSAEIIELHHDGKADAPSGTALTTARRMAQARGRPFVSPPPPGGTAGSRGDSIEGIHIHSVRLPGLLAHQEVIFGGPGQTLTIRHDTSGRECYMPGVLLAVKAVVRRRGLVRGLGALMGLEEPA